MHDELTKNDIQKMQEELDYRTKELMPELIEEVKRTTPFGLQVLGRHVGDRFTVKVSESYSYEAEILSITKTEDDGSAPLLGF